MVSQLGPQSYGYQPQATQPIHQQKVGIYVYANDAPTAPQAPYQESSVYKEQVPNQYQSYIPPQETYRPAPKYGPQPAMPPEQAPVQRAPLGLPAPQTSAVAAQPMPAPVLQEQSNVPPVAVATEPAPAQQAANVSSARQTTAPNLATNVAQLLNGLGSDDKQTHTEAALGVKTLINGSAEESQAAINGLVSMIQSQDNKTQEAGITMIANLANGTEKEKSAAATVPVLNALANVASMDTSTLQGPSDAQIAAINKAASGAPLTAEEHALATNMAPKTAANKNKVISMFTLGMVYPTAKAKLGEAVQKHNSELPQGSAPLPMPKTSDLIGFDALEGAARSADDKEVQLAAIQTLSFVAKPEDKDTLKPVFDVAMQSNEPLVKEFAAEGLQNIGAAPQEQQPDVSKMTPKEKKAFEKAQKKAEKEAAKAKKAA